MSMLKPEKMKYDDGRTKQSFKEQVNINSIVAKARKTGFVNHVNNRQPYYADVSQIPDYRTACEIVSQSNRQFMELPSNVRERFDNDPGKFLEFFQDEKNLDEAVKLGLVNKPVEEPAPAPVEPK